MKARNRAAMSPPRTGEITQLAAILPIVIQFTTLTIDPMAMPSTEHFIRGMISALLAAGIWLHMATYIGAPVSTTHSIVGGVLGAGIASVDVNVVNWMTMGKIAAPAQAPISSPPRSCLPDK